MDKLQILKKAMKKKYCGKTRFDYLDEEEIPMILNAMETYRRAEPADSSAVAKEIKKAIELIGNRYITTAVGKLHNIIKHPSPSGQQSEKACPKRKNIPKKQEIVVQMYCEKCKTHYTVKAGEICPECKGDGGFNHINGLGTRKECTNCNGTGRKLRE